MKGFLYHLSECVYMLSRSVISDSLQPRGLELTRLLCSWNFQGKNPGADCHFLLQGIFLTQGLNPCPLSHVGSPTSFSSSLKLFSQLTSHQNLWVNSTTMLLFSENQQVSLKTVYQKYTYINTYTNIQSVLACPNPKIKGMGTRHHWLRNSGMFEDHYKSNHFHTFLF